MNAHHTAPKRTRAITTPRTSLQGTGAVVRIERRKGERVQGLWAEGIPFRHLAELRSLEHARTTPDPLRLRTDDEQPSRCAGGTACLKHPDCADTACAGHPDNSAEQAAFDLRGMDYSDHHGPAQKARHAYRARFWQLYTAGTLLALAAGAWLIF
jgi:hypothetical protein